MAKIASSARQFIIFSMARSGTSWLTTSLRSHPEILCHGEALLPRHIPKHLFGSARDVLTAQDCQDDPLGFIHRLFSMNDGHPIVGCKVFPGHSKPAQKPLLEDEGISKIVLRRENALAAWSSLLIARETGRWNTKRKNVARDDRTHFVREDFERFLNRRDQFFERVDRLARGPRLDITYSKDVMQARAEPVLEFLGASPKYKTSSNKQKMLGRSILDRYENAAHVRDYLDEIGRPDWAYE